MFCVENARSCAKNWRLKVDNNNQRIPACCTKVEFEFECLIIHPVNQLKWVSNSWCFFSQSSPACQVMLSSTVLPVLVVKSHFKFISIGDEAAYAAAVSFYCLFFCLFVSLHSLETLWATGTKFYFSDFPFRVETSEVWWPITD